MDRHRRLFHQRRAARSLRVRLHARNRQLDPAEGLRRRVRLQAADGALDDGPRLPAWRPRHGADRPPPLRSGLHRARRHDAHILGAACALSGSLHRRLCYAHVRRDPPRRHDSPRRHGPHRLHRRRPPADVPVGRKTRLERPTRHHPAFTQRRRAHQGAGRHHLAAFHLRHVPHPASPPQRLADLQGAALHRRQRRLSAPTLVHRCVAPGWRRVPQRRFS